MQWSKDSHQYSKVFDVVRYGFYCLSCCSWKGMLSLQKE